MELTINWSPQAAALLREGKIRLDRFKCADWDDMIASACADAPVYVHFPLIVGRGALKRVDWARVDRLMRETNTPHVNLHLEPLRSVTGELPDQDVIALCISEVNTVVEKYGRDNVVVENVPYRAYQVDKYEIAVQPGAITDVITTAGCRLLLDIGHARIAADALGMDAYAYMEALPLDRLAEVHTAGVTTFTRAMLETASKYDGFEAYFDKYEGEKRVGVLMDHFGMESAADWEHLGWLIERIRDGRAGTPRFISYEYGGVGAPFVWRSETDVIARDMPRFNAATQR